MIMGHSKMGTEQNLYVERLTSKRTTLFFALLSVLSFLLAIMRASWYAFEALALTLAFFSVFFLFYTVNYRVLEIKLTAKALNVTFGIFSWEVPFSQIAGAQVDSLPVIKQYGGAGIHFMFVRKRYRASFNFLEHPRVVVVLKKKIGLVQDISFSTRHPDEVIQLIKDGMGISAGEP